MSANGGNDRVTNAQLYRELTELRKDLSAADDKLWPRKEGMAVVASALILGQIAARLDIGTVRLPVAPMQTSLELLTRIF